MRSVCPSVSVSFVSFEHTGFIPGKLEWTLKISEIQTPVTSVGMACFVAKGQKELQGDPISSANVLGKEVLSMNGAYLKIY